MKRYVNKAVLFLWVVSMAQSEAHGITLNAHRYFVILAGGSGERLWPISHKARPKQLLTVGRDKTLLEQAIDRIENLAHSAENIWVVTTENHEQEIRNCVQDQVGTILVEPVARNTGPAILHCCLKIRERDPQATVIFLPADPFIPAEDNHEFEHVLAHTIDFVERHDAIGLLGIKPTFPATGYGYINYETTMHDARTGMFGVRAFHEKPNQDTAHEYITHDNMLWNISIFASRVNFFIDEFAHAAPETFGQVMEFFHGSRSYGAIDAISVDYAVIEKSKHVWVHPASFSWCDVGNVGVFLSLKKQCNSLNQNTIEVDAFNNLVDVPDKLIALVGVNDLCVVQTDDVLLITKREEAEKVRSVVTQLKEAGRNDYL